MIMYVDNFQHLQAELDYAAALVKQGLQHAEFLQSSPLSITDYAPWLARAADNAVELRTVLDAGIAASQAQGIVLRLPLLLERLGLNSRERDILLLCLAPMLDSRYGQLYSYMQQDMHAKYPGENILLQILNVDLSTAWQIQKLLALTSSLQGILEKQDNHYQVNTSIAHYLLESDDIALELQDSAYLLTPTQSLADIYLTESLQQELEAIATPQWFYLQGPIGSGKQTLVEALAYEQQRAVLVINTSSLLQQPYEHWPRLLSAIVREARLHNALCYWQQADRLFSAERMLHLNLIERRLLPLQPLLFLSGETAVPLQVRLPLYTIVVDKPDLAIRTVLWHKAIKQADISLAPQELQALAQRFHLYPGQITQAVSHAASRSRQNTYTSLLHACQQQTQYSLNQFATCIKPMYQRADIILPELQSEQLDELIAYSKYYEQVFTHWEFNKKLARGKGLAALFTGPPGTGKTLAAEVVAQELGLLLYKVDLAAMVSKYIGETEKQLSALFDQAAEADAVLFFDEADSLFAKRSEVQSSHDRYANLQTNYLLQRLESHAGIIILASNYKNNIDEAFLRRLQFTIDFVLPSAQERLRMWQQVWPEALPISAIVDRQVLAEKLELTGGHIRNIALAAAFKAAQAGAAEITLEHIIHAVHREEKKLGKITHINDISTLLATGI